MADSNSQSGGFLPASLPSPSPSATSSSPTSNLPHPRSNPLRPGSAKEDAARRYIEGRLLVVSRRYAKKYQPMEVGDDVKGYEGFGEVSRDLGVVVDVVWLSGTLLVEVMGREREVETEIEGEESAIETDGCSTQGDGDGNLKWEMEVARVYDMTIIQLGEALGQGEAFTVDLLGEGTGRRRTD
ncbi:meiotic recombination protein DMC [Marssonina coronariae]|uniref:Meiotic recombination protein DMC n=1 Tax=Diplocarpon coronariae TaxID=2795749 RepID=A0A218Z6G2_9HELO|nr:meiotic recombination protein DMC [Marssonina coronariae]